MRSSLAQQQEDLNVKQHFRSSLPLQLLYEDSQMVTLTAPYIAGFLAFRETPFLLEALQRLQRNRPELLPQVRLEIVFKWKNQRPPDAFIVFDNAWVYLKSI